MASRVLAGRYDLKEKIGEGGMSVVFRAQDMVLNRYVAVKILRPEYTKDEQFISSFRRESQLAASIVDSNIVNVYDVGREGNIYFIVMELVDGMPLSDIIKKEGPLDPRRAASIARQIASALSTAHKHHLIHRDVKPHNVLLSKDDVAKIADFGIAKEVTNDTLVGDKKEAVMGSIHYFSPEQARGTGVDERSDIYSLGIVLYEMVTGQVPFDGDSAVEVAVKHISEPMVPPSRVNPSIPQDIEDIIMKATQKNPDSRYNNADEMITALSFVKFSKPSEYGQELEEQEEDKEEVIDVNRILDEQNEKEEKKNNRKKFNLDFLKKRNSAPKTKEEKADKIVKAVAIILAIALAIPVSGLIYDLGFNPEKKVKEINLPNFVGMSLDAANESYPGYNLSIVTEMEVFSEEFDAGIIISQTPDADAVVKTGSEVKVTVSKGVQEGTIPKVVGKAQYKNGKRNNAEVILNSYGYELGKVTYKSSTSMEAGYVISQNPEAGTIASKGTKVNLVVSTGPDEGTSGGAIDTTGGAIVVDGDSIKITIPSGSKVSTMGDILAEAGLCDSSSDFVNKVKELGLDKKLRSGDYTISTSATLEEIVKIIAHQK